MLPEVWMPEQHVLTLTEGLVCEVPSTSTLPCSMAAWSFDLVVLGMLVVRKASSLLPLPGCGGSTVNS